MNPMNKIKKSFKELVKKKLSIKKDHEELHNVFKGFSSHYLHMIL